MTAPGEARPFYAEDVDPASFFAGTLLLTVPHQDDGVLGCGATLARRGGGSRVHVVYATDGSASPVPLLRRRDVPPSELALIRAKEATEAMGRLGVPAGNIHFLGLPDGRLRSHGTELRHALRALIDRIHPDHVLTPFRYDQNTDHLALNRAVTAVFVDAASPRASLTEYFVYHQMRLLPRGDVRAYVRRGALHQVSPGEMARVKREVLDCFRSQTTRFYPWQTRPNLTPRLLDEVSAAPEVYLRYDPTLPGARVLTSSRAWIVVAHRLEPVLKKRKDQLVALSRRILGGGAGANPPPEP